MNRRLFAVAVLAAAAVPFALRGEDKPDYVAHEWGTFTSMQGSDGTVLEGLQHEEEGLPGFVYSRSEVRDCPFRAHGYKGLEVDVENVTKKMETPVIYFYAKQPLHVRARVCFNRGLLTQWYPVSDLLGPPERAVEDGPLDMAKVERSFLEWGVDVLGPGAGLGGIPEVPADDPWAMQRLPDSNVVRTEERRAPRRGPQEHEKFLFYRGLGAFELPVVAKTEPDLRLTIANNGADAIRHLFVVHVRDGVGRFTYVEEAPAGGTITVEALRLEKAAPVADMIARLRPALESKLVAEGLYPKEAEAMTRTWERSYFRTEGLRVLYMVPRAFVDRILPVALDPAPREFVRVLVGRLECLTPEDEAEVEAALRDWNSADGPTHAAAQRRLDRCGRFLEPYLRRILASSKDERALANARAILASPRAAGTDSVRPAGDRKKK